MTKSVTATEQEEAEKVSMKVSVFISTCRTSYRQTGLQDAVQRPQLHAEARIFGQGLKVLFKTQIKSNNSVGE
jgi:hypothetical protein